jgi:hypothetical protein
MTPNNCLAGGTYEKPVGGGGGAFSAIILRVVDIAFQTASQELARRRDALWAYDRVEWAKAELEGPLIQQAYARMVRAIEDYHDWPGSTVQGELAIAEPAESALHWICRVR